jgi:hypothetical protein
VADRTQNTEHPAPVHGALTPAQVRNRERVERVIGVAAPFLDLVLAVGDRISRIAEPEDYEYYPVRAGELRERTASRQGRGQPSGD